MKNMNIAVIDYKMSNMFSIKNALDVLGYNSKITSKSREILKADGAVLPGVGSFPDAMQHLHDLELINVIKEFISSGKPFMGICLGLQLLFSESEEFGRTNGLGVLEGKVESFAKHEGVQLVPHVGWNTIVKNGLREDEMLSSNPLKEIRSGEHFYFVHSFYVNPDNEGDILTTTEYHGLEFCSSVLRDNVFACQFHPEKSGATGLEILADFFIDSTMAN